MKIRFCFAAMVILTILFSLTTVVASENITDGGLNDVLLSVDAESMSLESQNTLNASESNVDLSVNVDVNPSYDNKTYNSVGSIVPWTITVCANGGTAKNAYLLNVLSNNLQYLSHNNTVGTFNPSTGTWKIGDLTEKTVASLTILTKLKAPGTYTCKVYALSDDKEKDFLNNYLIVSMKTGSSKITSTITETTTDRLETQHTVHQASMYNARLWILNDEEFGGDDSGKDDSDSDDSGGKDDDEKKNSDKPDIINNKFIFFSNDVQKTFSLTNIISLMSDDIISDSIRDFSLKTISAWPPYDYTRIPILIFVMFLIILMVSIGADKIKSKS